MFGRSNETAAIFPKPRAPRFARVMARVAMVTNVLEFCVLGFRRLQGRSKVACAARLQSSQGGAIFEALQTASTAAGFGRLPPN
jgi:hypothetical protein